MTKEKKKTEEQADSVTPAASPPAEAESPAAPAATPPQPKPDAPELTRVQYTGQTPGTIRDEKTGAMLVYHVEPGDVLDPETDKERKALIDSGHFELTRHRATTTATTDAETRRVAEQAAAAEAAAKAAEEKK